MQLPLNRLGFQKDIFANRANRNLWMDRLTRHLPPACFLGRVLAALIHFGWGDPGLAEVRARPGPDQPVLHPARRRPARGGGRRRTLRSAYEFARNKIHYEAKHAALSALETIFLEEPDAGAKLRQMWYCENLLEFEHLEWARLM